MTIALWIFLAVFIAWLVLACLSSTAPPPSPFTITVAIILIVAILVWWLAAAVQIVSASTSG